MFLCKKKIPIQRNNTETKCLLSITRNEKYEF